MYSSLLMYGFHCILPSRYAFISGHAPPARLSHSTAAVAVSRLRSIAITGMSNSSNKDTETPNQAEIIIAKQRNGQIGSVELLFQANITKFKNKAVRPSALP